MSTIANAKVAHNYNRYNGYFFGCLLIIILVVVDACRNCGLRTGDFFQKSEALYENILRKKNIADYKLPLLINWGIL